MMETQQSSEMQTTEWMGGVFGGAVSVFAICANSKCGHKWRES